MAASQVNI